MSAYLISEVEVLDEARWEIYRTIAADSIFAFGGAYLSRGATVEVAEADWPREPVPPQQVIVVEFASFERIHHWYRSAQYAKALEFRNGAVKRRLIFVDSSVR